MNNTITLNYYSKEIYGQTMFYLASNVQRTCWQKLSGKKTIAQDDMEHLTHLTGVTFVRVFEAVD